MKEIIPNGTEVLIFKYVSGLGPKQDDEHYILGIILSSEMSENLSYHGSSWHERIYTVLGKDGNKYIGTYGTGLLGNSFFRTREDHVEILKRKILNNIESISMLQEENVEYNNQIELLKGKKRIRKILKK